MIFERSQEKIATKEREPDGWNFECLKLRREILAREIDYRREKRWRIFSWTSSILLAAIAGVIALTGKGFNFPTWPNRMLSAVAILSVTIYALVWISLNRAQESSLERDMTRYDDDLQIMPIEKEHPFPLGYRMSILVTAVFAVSVILFVG